MVKKMQRVLILDSNTIRQNIYTQVVDIEHFELRFARDLIDAQEIYRMWMPHIVLIDDELENGLALSFIKIIRNDNGDDLTKILITLNKKNISLLKDLQIRSDYIQFQLKKPFKYTQLNRILNEFHSLVQDKSLDKFYKLCLLVVEDDKRIIDLYARYISADIFDLHFVQNGKDALKAYKNIFPDIIILDIMLPDLDGINVLQQIRKQNMDNKTTIIMATCKSEMDAILQCVQNHVQGYLIKPFNLKTIDKKIGKYYAQHQNEILMSS